MSFLRVRLVLWTYSCPFLNFTATIQLRVTFIFSHGESGNPIKSCFSIGCAFASDYSLTLAYIKKKNSLRNLCFHALTNKSNKMYFLSLSSLWLNVFHCIFSGLYSIIALQPSVFNVTWAILLKTIEHFGTGILSRRFAL